MNELISLKRKPSNLLPSSEGDGDLSTEQRKVQRVPSTGDPSREAVQNIVAQALTIPPPSQFPVSLHCDDSTLISRQYSHQTSVVAADVVALPSTQLLQQTGAWDFPSAEPVDLEKLLARDVFAQGPGLSASFNPIEEEAESSILPATPPPLFIIPDAPREEGADFRWELSNLLPTSEEAIAESVSQYFKQKTNADFAFKMRAFAERLVLFSPDVFPEVSGRENEKEKAEMFAQIIQRVQYTLPCYFTLILLRQLPEVKETTRFNFNDANCIRNITQKFYKDKYGIYNHFKNSTIPEYTFRLKIYAGWLKQEGFLFPEDCAYLKEQGIDVDDVCKQIERLYPRPGSHLVLDTLPSATTAFSPSSASWLEQRRLVENNAPKQKRGVHSGGNSYNARPPGSEEIQKAIADVKHFFNQNSMQEICLTCLIPPEDKERIAFINPRTAALANYALRWTLVLIKLEQLPKIIDIPEEAEGDFSFLLSHFFREISSNFYPGGKKESGKRGIEIFFKKQLRRGYNFGLEVFLRYYLKNNLLSEANQNYLRQKHGIDIDRLSIKTSF